MKQTLRNGLLGVLLFTGAALTGCAAHPYAYSSYYNNVE